MGKKLLTADDIADLKGRLLAEREDLEKDDETGAEGRKTVELDQQSVGRLSRMDALQQQAMAQAQARRRATRRARIDAALKRMTEDEYGYCEDCGDDIALKRLLLDPTAPKCLSCANG